MADEEKKLQIAIERGRAFLKAGADCVFIPGLVDEMTVSALAKEIDGPINIILNSAFHDFNRMEKIGVRRLSVGSSPARFVYGKTIGLAQNLKIGEAMELRMCDFTYKLANDYFDR